MLSLIPTEWKLVTGAIGTLALLCLLGVAVAAIEKHGEDKATAVLQPKLDQANRDIGTLEAANATDQETIRQLQADQQANDALVEQYATQVAADNQKAADAAAAIRKLQSDDQTVDAYLRTPVPAALRRLLVGPDAHGGAAGGANQDGGAAAAH